MKRRAEGRSRSGKDQRRRRQTVQIIESLCNWFDREARDLPWRKHRRRNGYHALVAEMMLQQTQVSRVKDSYVAFIRRYPTAAALAAANEQQVLAMWQGLGYYRRARHLHQAAKMIVREFGGTMPRCVRRLLQLPGVGRYTAGAIASIVYGEAAPIVDGNVQRVLMRWHGKRDQHGKSTAVKWSWSKAEEWVLQAKRPGVFNEAMMELGAVICTPRSPRCGTCPASTWCEARRKNLQHQIPRAASRTTPRLVHHHAVIITCNGKVLVEKREMSPNGRMWESMWQAPTIESDKRLSEVEIRSALPVRVADLAQAEGFDHHTSHRRIRFHVYRARARLRQTEGGTWRTPDALRRLPMSAAQRRILQGLHTSGL